MENIRRDNGNLAECCTAANGLQSSSSGALVLLDDHSVHKVLGVDLELVLVEGHVNGVALGRGERSHASKEMKAEVQQGIIYLNVWFIKKT